MENSIRELKKKPLAVAGIGGVTIVILFILDVPIWQEARDLIPPDYDVVAKLITHWGIYVFYAIFMGLLVYSLVTKQPRLAGLCWAYLKAQLIFSFAVVRILKIVLGRARPGHGAEFTFFSLNSRFNGFPSGHSADAFVSGVFLYFLLKHSSYAGCRFLPLIYAFLIAVSRVFVSAHYPSDVAVGMIIGILGAWYFVSRLPNPDEPEKIYGHQGPKKQRKPVCKN
jgi:membrane-associated phospholipid phosphatase